MARTRQRTPEERLLVHGHRDPHGPADDGDVQAGPGRSRHRVRQGRPARLSEVPASINYVVPSRDYARRTTLSRNGVSIYTVEHVLAALAGLGIDNAVVELDADEPAEPD